jgi:glycogen debranching enzyme
LIETIELKNFGREAVQLSLRLTFGSDFEDVFTIRGLMGKKRGTPTRPLWKDGCLFFSYRGADQVARSLTIHFSPTADGEEGTTATFKVALQPGESWELGISLALAESEEASAPQPCSPVERHLEKIKHALDQSSNKWLSHETAVESNSLLLNQVVRRSLLDLHVLESSLKGDRFFAAGVPWFVILFGRDSLITALQTLAYDPDIARDTLQLMAQYQGSRIDHWRDEEPGKIPHELRVGELARLQEIPIPLTMGRSTPPPSF